MKKIEFVGRGDHGHAESAQAVLVFQDSGLSAEAQELDDLSSGAVSAALARGRLFDTEHQVLVLSSPPALQSSHLVLVGVGSRAALDAQAMEDAAARAYAGSKCLGPACLDLRLWSLPAELAAHAALGMRLAAYRFDKYRTREEPKDKPSVRHGRLVVTDPKRASEWCGRLAHLADGVTLARDLVSEPPNILFPEAFAARLKELEAFGLEVEILGEAEMTELGMNALLCVGQGSPRSSCLVVMRWDGGDGRPPVLVAGKGVCFDAGGVSIKHAEGMWEMKWDMGGAATVAGLMQVLAAREARANVIGIVGLVENMPDGAAVRPGDVVTSMSGQTIEVIDTDAEGRLVLADALWYAQERFKPAAMVDLATLTSAIITGLGHHYGGLFSNDDTLARQLIQAGEKEGELLWRMPLHQRYAKLLDSPIADMRNVGGPAAASITAALFIERFTGGAPWAHLDIASIAWRKDSDDPRIPDGATGYGVRLLNAWIEQNHEAQP